MDTNGPGQDSVEQRGQFPAALLPLALGVGGGGGRGLRGSGSPSARITLNSSTVKYTKGEEKSWVETDH